MNITSKRLKKTAIPQEKPKQHSCPLRPYSNLSSQNSQLLQQTEKRDGEKKTPHCKAVWLNIYSCCTNNKSVWVLCRHLFNKAQYSLQLWEVLTSQGWLPGLPRSAFGIKWDCKSKFLFSCICPWTFSLNEHKRCIYSQIVLSVQPVSM